MPTGKNINQRLKNRDKHNIFRQEIFTIFKVDGFFFSQYHLREKNTKKKSYRVFATHTHTHRLAVKYVCDKTIKLCSEDADERWTDNLIRSTKNCYISQFKLVFFIEINKTKARELNFAPNGFHRLLLRFRFYLSSIKI